ncbi:DUF2461 domain-containing protein [Mucilaginibacter koreensis]
MIRKETFSFLHDLAQNNNREWFQDNKERYDAAQQNVVDFAAELIKGLSKIDATISADKDPKKCVLRIYRDVRFSKDKTPYKTNMSVGRLRTGNAKEGIGYFLQIEPGASFIAGGYWMPQAEDLKAIRQEIDYNAAELKNIVDAPEFKQLFGDFRNQEKLKVMPKGYEPDNENIELLKLKSFAAIHDLKDTELQSADAVQHVTDLCGKIQPLNIFLANAIA